MAEQVVKPTAIHIAIAAGIGWAVLTGVPVLIYWLTGGVAW